MYHSMIHIKKSSKMQQCIKIYFIFTSTNYMANNPPSMQNQRQLVWFYAPDDGRCVAQNMLSFI
jgi:hypothetical protein